MSIHALQERLAELPLLKILPLFLLGILLHRAFVLPIGVVVSLFVVSGLGSMLLKRGSLMALALLSAGYLVADLQPRSLAVPTNQPLTLDLRLRDDGMLRGERLRFEAELIRWQDPATANWQSGRGGLWLYADSTLRLAGGDRLLMEGKIYPFRSDSTSFPTMMQMRGYLGRCYLNPYSLLEQKTENSSSLHLRASRTMQRRLGEQSDRSALVRAMTVGDRSGITPELRTAYARSGTSHLLAVSGLHTGMLFLLVNLILWWLPIIHRGHRLRNLLVLVAVWLFVAAAGFPPSAVRAAVMCSMLQWALFTSAPYRALNGWAAAALLLLIFRPYWLFDIGFQLSFLAVWAILAWGVPLCRRCHTHYRLVNWVVDALLISLTASLATAPLASHHFGIIPLIGICINPLAIALGTCLVVGGLLLLLLPPVAPLLRPVILQLATWQNNLVEWVASWEAGYIEYHLPEGLTGLVYLLFLLLTLLLWCRDRKKSVHL